MQVPVHVGVAAFLVHLAGKLSALAVAHDGLGDCCQPLPPVRRHVRQLTPLACPGEMQIVSDGQ